MADVKKYGLSGVGSTVELGKQGAKIKNNAGVVEIKNNADDAFAKLRVANAVGSNDAVNKTTMETAIGTALTSAVVYKSVFDASNSNYNAITDPKQGWLYKVSVEGTISNVEWKVGDNLIINKDVTGHPVAADVDKIDNTEATDILRTGDVSSNADFTQDTAKLASRATIATYVAAQISAIPAGDAATPTRTAALAFGTSSPLNIGAALPANAKVKNVVINVVTPFNGTAPTLNIGVAGTPDALMAAAQIDLKTAGLYIGDCFVKYTSATQLIATYAADSSSAGAADLEIEYSV